MVFTSQSDRTVVRVMCVCVCVCDHSSSIMPSWCGHAGIPSAFYPDQCPARAAALECDNVGPSRRKKHHYSEDAHAAQD